MKSLEAQLAELKETIIPAEVKAGFSEAAAQSGWKDAMSGKSVEQQLSIAKEKAKKLGISESRKKVTRNNGSSQFSENDTKSRDERVIHFMESGSMNYREACYLIGETPERDAKQTESITESIAKRWKKYAPWLSNKDARTLAEKGLIP